MQIALLRTGGYIPITKKAETEVEWTDNEIKELLKAIGNESEGSGQARDATGYHLVSNAGTFSIDLDKVPAKYKKTFEELRQKLAVLKR